MAIEGVLLDIDGVLVVSWQPIPGAPEAVRLLRKTDIPFRLVTNTTTHSRASLAEALRAAGFDVRPEEMVTAPVATASYLRSRHPGARCFLLAKGDGVQDLEGIQIVDEDADVVVVGGAEEQFSYENLNRAFRMLVDGAVLVAMHRNLSWMTSEGLKLDAGAFVTGLEEASGVRATVAGKPSPEFFRQALALLGLPAESAAMVGDDIHNDVLAAQALGITGVLVRTGKFRAEALERASGRPDHVIGSVRDLPGLIASH